MTNYDTHLSATPEEVLEQAKALNESTPPEDRVLTMDEARATVIRATMAVVFKSIEEFKDLAVETPSAEENKRSLLRASTEFFATLENQVRRFERPAILRPTRSRKVVR